MGFVWDDFEDHLHEELGKVLVFGGYVVFNVSGEVVDFGIDPDFGEQWLVVGVDL